MPTPPVYIDPMNQQLRTTLQNLPPVPGYCIFMDIAGSTAMKQQGIFQWVAYIFNAFSNARAFLSPFPPLKSVGDELMFYIEERDLMAAGYTPLQIFDGLWSVTSQNAAGFPMVRTSIAKCVNVYSITFMQGTTDYYGIDIDMTARLLSLASPREIATEVGFFAEVMSHYTQSGNQEQFTSVTHLQGPTNTAIRGLPQPISVYMAR